VGRVVAEYAGAFVVWGEHGESEARIAGRLRHDTRTERGEQPAVGDWVAFTPAGGGEGENDGLGLIHRVLPRKTKLSRRAAGQEAIEQVIAANLDTVFVVTSLGQDEFNPRRLERYLAAVWEGGAKPVLVLTKTDLADDAEAARRSIEHLTGRIPVHGVSALSGDGLEELDRYLRPGETLALVGSSGVGKSTLVNHWLGQEAQDVSAVRADGKGRHTTSHRQIFVLPSGALVIDTPGMRELGLWADNEGLEESYGDVEELAALCRFRDCRHQSEPGCAVKAAVESGDLSIARLEGYMRLKVELGQLSARRDEQARREERGRERRLSREIKRAPKRRR